MPTSRKPKRMRKITRLYELWMRRQLPCWNFKVRVFRHIKEIEDDIQQLSSLVVESDATTVLWHLAADKWTLQSKQSLLVMKYMKIINADSEDPKHIINMKQCSLSSLWWMSVIEWQLLIAEEWIRVGMDRNKYQIHISLPAKIYLWCRRRKTRCHMQVMLEAIRNKLRNWKKWLKGLYPI